MELANISVFLDERSLECGAGAVAGMEHATASARVIIVLLSAEYMRREWPLKELHIALDRVCKHRLANPAAARAGPQSVPAILPVYWFSSPSECFSASRKLSAAAERHRQYGNDLPARLYAELGLEQGVNLQQSADDLSMLGGITGCRKNQFLLPDDLFENLTLQILQILQKYKRLDMPVSIGLQPRVDQVLDLLEPRQGQRGPSLMILHGQGGIGKTALATAVYNEVAKRIVSGDACR